MKILFVIPAYKPAYHYGGTTVVVSQLAESLVAAGHEVVVYTTTANGKKELKVGVNKETIINGVKVIYFNRITGDHTHVSPMLWYRLWKTLKQYDVVHLHSWWNVLIMVAAKICLLRRIKPILSPHGMLSEFSFKVQKSVLKKLLHTIVGRSLLSKTALHVSTELEFNDCRKIIPDWDATIISNLVELPHYSYRRKKNEVFTVGFLSRIDPKKGLELLIKALAKVKFQFKLLIAGDGKDMYIKDLKGLIEKVEIADRTEWVGWQDGEEKFNYLASIDLFSLISYNENFAIVVLEALSVGTPVLVSEHVGLAEYVKKNQFGLVTSLETEDIVANLNRGYAKFKSKINSAVQLENDFGSAELVKQYLVMYKVYNNS